MAVSVLSTRLCAEKEIQPILRFVIQIVSRIHPFFWQLLPVVCHYLPTRTIADNNCFADCLVRTASQSTGASCHSSIRRGVSPINNNDGLEAAVAAYSSCISVSCILMTLLLICSAVVVFPHHLGPSISTAPKASRRSASWRSAILCE